MTLRDNQNNRQPEFISGTMSRKLIYVYKKLYKEEEGFVKIGEASIDRFNADLSDNSSYLQERAEKRIREYELTSEIQILYTTFAVDNQYRSFSDKDVHKVMENSGIKKIIKGKSTEWFKANLQQVKEAINAVKENASYVKGLIERVDDSFVFRPEQDEAIKKTINVFKKHNQMLWNAKMRFGKTLCALELVKRMNFQKTLVITHRPIVGDGWFDEFDKLFKHTNYDFGSKRKGEKIENLKSNSKPFVYFASIQDLRGSSVVNDDTGIDKNYEIFNVNWDFVIIDEAHEGADTKLAQKVKEKIVGEETKLLALSGTPFNLLDKYEDSQVYTWNYVMEQQAKKDWNKDGENPYGDLPELKMFVYSLGDYIKRQEFIEDKAFNFAEFFAVDDSGKFIYEKYVNEFLNLITHTDTFKECKTNMPFSTEEYRNQLRHTLWTLPSRSSAVALEKLLKNHPIFRFFNIANLSDDPTSTEEDLNKIKTAITDSPQDNYSITLTVRKGTVGITVKEWTGILVLNNTESATTYLQSIFRVQSPYNGSMGKKEKAYVFDFAPDRTLKMVAEAAKLNTKAGSLNSAQQRKEMGQLLNFLPIIGMEGNKMEPYDVERMMSQLKQAQAERAVRHGFDDTSIYNDELLKLDNLDLKKFDNLRKIVGLTKQTKKLNEININNQGLSNEEYELSEKATKKPKKELTAEEVEALQKRKELKEQKDTLISILRGISIRIPLMIYGMDLDISESITIDNFVDYVDEISWKEFMPNGVTKDLFNEFKKYYDPDVFSNASHKIRQIAYESDKLSIEERIDKITDLFSNFKNPDKETVLTPWRVVNMHLGDCLGGYNFFDKEYKEKLVNNNGYEIEYKTRYIDKEGITKNVFNKNSKILEINSKTGLYPLYVAYSIYKTRWESERANWDKAEYKIRERALWQQVLENNIYVLCKTPMARTITYCTLYGYKLNDKLSTNIIYVEDLISNIKNDLNATAKEIMKKFGEGNMKFDAVVGNPPYQEKMMVREIIMLH